MVSKRVGIIFKKSWNEFKKRWNGFLKEMDWFFKIDGLGFKKSWTRLEIASISV